MPKREIEIPEFLKDKPREISKERAELYKLVEAYEEMFGDHDYTNIFMSDEEQIEVLKYCLKNHCRFDDATGVSSMDYDEEYI